MKLLSKLYMAFSATSILVLLLCLGRVDHSKAERDFNFNDSQVPMLEPKDEPPHVHQDPYTVEVSHCHSAESEIVLSLVLKNHDWNDLNNNKKTKLLEKLSHFFAIPREFIIIDSITKHELIEMQKESIHKGNNKCHNSNNRQLGRVSFVLGCDSTLFTMSEPITKQIGTQMKDGSIDNITGEKFCWWVIWRKQFKTRVQRSRRQVEGSGEDDVDDYDDYEYGDDEQDTVETVTEVPAVTTHAHRHHHGVSQPELIENELELPSNNRIPTIPETEVEVEDNVAVAASSQANSAVDENKLLLSSKNANIDEDIVQSVSQLESVITKTIENTKNIKELPITSDEDEDVPVTEEIEKELEKPNELGGFDKAIEKTNEVNANGVDFSSTVSSIAISHIAAAAVINQNLHRFSNADETNLTDKDTKVEDDIEIKDPFNQNIKGDSGLPNIVDSSTTMQSPSSTKSAITLAEVMVSSAANEAAVTPSSNVISTSKDSFSTSTTILRQETTRPPTLEAFFASTIATTLLTLTSEKPSQSFDASATTSVLSSSTSPTLSYAASSSSLPSSISPTSSSTASLSISTPATTATALSVTTLSTKQQASEKSQQSQLQPQRKISSDGFDLLRPSNSVDDINIALVTIPDMPNIVTTPLISTLGANSQDVHSAQNTYEMTTMMTAVVSTPHTDVQLNGYSKKDDNETTESSYQHNQNGTVSLTTTTTPQGKDVYGNSPITISTSPSSTVTTSTSTTSDAASITGVPTDYVEPKIENSPPIIHTRLQKFAVTSGKAFSFVIPRDTFYDNEDLTNVRLELTDKDGHELKPSSWLQFNSETHTLYGLPLDDAVSKWQYRLSATDSGNESVTETLEMTVQQHRGVRTVNHEISITVKINEKNIPSIDWQLKLTRAIASTLEDENTNWIVVREVRQMPQDSNTATFVYFNETLPTSECPEYELNKLVKRLDASKLSDLVYPTLGVKSITGQLIGACQKSHITKPIPTTHVVTNLSPIPRNQVDRVNATVGHLLVFKVPSDTFYDPNDNEPLTLTLKTKDHKDLNPRYWLQFDSKNQEFYGIPKSGDIGSEEYLLVAEDAGGLTATDALVVVVNHAPKKEFSVYFKAFLAIRHEQFNADLQRKFVERISELFGDSGTQNIQIRSVTTHHDSDGTIVNFYNTTLYKTHNRCPEEEIEAARSVYLIKDTVLRDHVKKMLGPELNLTNVQTIPLGLCNPQTDREFVPFVPTKTDEPTLKSSFSEEYMFTIILPAVIIVSMILIASLIACCLYRRRRKSGKMELGDEEERKSFRTKGIPVIFQDELDEKPEIGNKSPIILKDEKPPLLPPSYNTSNMNGENDVDEYLPPPAVVVGGREARGKSPATPSYRKPPPYVSP